MRLLRRLVLVGLALLVPALAAAQTYTITPSPFQTAFNNSGAIINAACIWTYQAGTSTPATTYSDTSGTPNTNPIIASSAGRFTAFLIAGNNYKFVYEAACTPPAHATVLRTADNIQAVPGSSSTVDLTGTAGESITANQAVYLSDGSGGKNAGQWYKADSSNTYSSITNTVGIATTNISTSATGTIRIAGSMSGFSALSVGLTYYVGAAGALTSTAPTNVRLVGQADSATSLVIEGDPPVQRLTSPTINVSIVTPLLLGCGIRLTLTSGTPVTTADVTGAATVYATPYAAGGWGAGVCAFYDGSANWSTIAFTETSIPLGTLTSGLPYDVFCFNNSGTMNCELLAWTNTTTRATALALQNGVLVKTGATTRRYIGTFYTTSTTQTEDSATKRFVWNYYNRVPRSLQKVESTQSWNYTTATVRQANGAAANQVELVVGVAEVSLDLVLAVGVANSAGGVNLSAGIGEDSTTTYAAGGLAQPVAANIQPIITRLMKFPAIGRHVYSWNEWSAAAGTTTWYANLAGVGSTVQAGLVGWILG